MHTHRVLLKLLFSDWFLFWQNIWPDLSQSTSITAPFKKTLWTFSLIVNSACLVAQWDQREIPIPASEGVSQLSAHQTCHPHNKTIAVFVLNLACPQALGVWEWCFRAVSLLAGWWPPNTHRHHFCVWKSTAEFPLSSLPSLCVVEADCSYLI